MARYGGVWQVGKVREVVVRQEKGLVRTQMMEKSEGKAMKTRPP